MSLSGLKLDIVTIERWRREAMTTSPDDRLWLNRCEALCNELKLLHKQKMSLLTRIEQLEKERNGG